MTELCELARDYEAGKLRAVEDDLDTFLRRNKQGILDYRGSFGKRANISMEQAIKLYILQIRAINPAAEIKRQMEEIEREIWYRGEWNRCEVNRSEIAREWCRRHAPGWRDHNVLAVVYVFERNKDRFLHIFNNNSPT